MHVTALSADQSDGLWKETVHLFIFVSVCIILQHLPEKICPFFTLCKFIKKVQSSIKPVRQRLIQAAFLHTVYEEKACNAPYRHRSAQTSSL